MLLTRSSICPRCKEENTPDALACASCGAALDWVNPSDEPGYPQPEEEAGFDLKRYARLLAWFIGLCLLTILIVQFRWGNTLPGQDPQVLEVEASHGVLVQDAEILNQQLINDTAQHDPTNSPEAAYVVGVNMPREGRVLEITVNDDFLRLDYTTRLRLANNLAERWRRIHAPHRAMMTLLALDGREVGGRTLTGVVWVERNPVLPPATIVTPTPLAERDLSELATPRPPGAVAPPPGEQTTIPSVPEAPGGSDSIAVNRTPGAGREPAAADEVNTPANPAESGRTPVTEAPVGETLPGPAAAPTAAPRGVGVIPTPGRRQPF